MTKSGAKNNPQKNGPPGVPRGPWYQHMNFFDLRFCFLAFASPRVAHKAQQAGAE